MQSMLPPHPAPSPTAGSSAPTSAVTPPYPAPSLTSAVTPPPVLAGLPAPFAVMHAFEVRAPSRTLVLATLSAAQRREWVTVLREDAEAGLTTSVSFSSSYASNGGAGGGGNAVSMAGAAAACPPLSSAQRAELLARLQRCSPAFEDAAAAVADIRRRSPTCAECGAPGERLRKGFWLKIRGRQVMGVVQIRFLLGLGGTRLGVRGEL